ncbi:MAG: hypothetical protein ACRELB_06190, partial [Polyangiaceae bacterium]
PPTIVPLDDAGGAAEQVNGDSYRRKMATFPLFEEAPRRRGVATLGVVMAGGMLLTFAIGWWLGRTSAPLPDASRASTPSARVAAAVASTLPPPATGAPATAAVPSAAASTATPPSASASASPEAPPPTASIAPSASPLASPAASAAVAGTQRSWAPEHSPVVLAPHPASTPAAVTAPPAPVNTPPPKPSAKPGGYVPEEL